MFAEIWSHPLELVQFFIEPVGSVKIASTISFSSWHLLLLKFNYKILAIRGLFSFLSNLQPQLKQLTFLETNYMFSRYQGIM